MPPDGTDKLAEQELLRVVLSGISVLNRIKKQRRETELCARKLDEISPLAVVEAEDHVALRPGQMLVGAGGT
jgi:hypothetical protein